MPYILLSSTRNDPGASRSFNEFSSLSDLAQTIIDYFEDWLSLKEPTQLIPEDSAFEYTSDELFSFMDDFFGELVCLEKHLETALWIPHTIDWIKEQVYFELRGQTQRQEANNKLNENCTTNSKTDYMMDTY